MSTKSESGDGCAGCIVAFLVVLGAVFLFRAAGEWQDWKAEASKRIDALEKSNMEK